MALDPDKPDEAAEPDEEPRASPRREAPPDPLGGTSAGLEAVDIDLPAEVRVPENLGLGLSGISTDDPSPEPDDEARGSSGTHRALSSTSAGLEAIDLDVPAEVRVPENLGMGLSGVSVGDPPPLPSPPAPR